MPIPENEENMEGEGWAKELTIKHIDIKQGIIYCQEWDFFANLHICSIREGGHSGPKCGTDHVWIKCFNGKLFWACAKHRITNGPISFDEGNKAKEYIIGPEEAINVCRDTGQNIPRELLGMAADERARASGKRRRPNQ